MAPANSITAEVDLIQMEALARVGRTLRGKWRLDLLLGIGGMAAVYAATHRNGTRAALKILHPELSMNPQVRARFLREGRVANTIPHPGVVKVADEDIAEDGLVFLVMELLDGESLEGRATRLGGKLPLDEVLAAAEQVLDVLAVAHDCGVVHRDLKPDNVFLTRHGQIKLLDFGIARLRELSASTGATHSGTAMGTPSFMPPEQARSLWDQVDGRSDLWAIGASMFSLLTGRPVHRGRTTNEQLLSAMTQPAPELAQVAPEVPEPVAAVIDRALAFDREARWPDARGMQRAVQSAYQAIHREPISSAAKLTIPPTVPDRTQPGAEPPPAAATADTTTQAVSTPSTGESAVKAPKRRPIAITAAAIVIVALLVTIGVALKDRGVPATADRDSNHGASPPGSEPPASANAPLESPALTPMQVPSASAEPGPAVRKPPSQTPPSAIKPRQTTRPSESAPAPAPAPDIPSDEWKERRR
jgi:eukaryotic-like serine/threonine-protein kinase